MDSPEAHCRALYAGMDEASLLDAARTYDGLTDAAQTALRAEFASRGLEAPLVDEEPDQPEKLVTVRRYRDLSEGIVARSLLQSAGLRAELRDENLIRIDWQLSNFIGGLRLQVPAEDAATAEELLDQAVVDPVPLGDGEEFDQPACPFCGSTQITFEGKDRLASITSLFVLSVPVPSGRETWHCETCNERWQDTEPE